MQKPLANQQVPQEHALKCQVFQKEEKLRQIAQLGQGTRDKNNFVTKQHSATLLSGPSLSKLIIDQQDKMSTAKLTIGELEAGYPLYCKALRRLLQQGRTADQIQRTVCWSHLETLNRCLPGRYKTPSYLMALIKRDLEQPKEED